jgi:hypothetical protein
LAFVLFFQKCSTWSIWRPLSTIYTLVPIAPISSLSPPTGHIAALCAYKAVVSACGCKLWHMGTRGCFEQQHRAHSQLGPASTSSSRARRHRQRRVTNKHKEHLAQLRACRWCSCSGWRAERQLRTAGQSLPLLWVGSRPHRWRTHAPHPPNIVSIVHPWMPLLNLISILVVGSDPSLQGSAQPV